MQYFLFYLNKNCNPYSFPIILRPRREEKNLCVVGNFLGIPSGNPAGMLLEIRARIASKISPGILQKSLSENLSEISIRGYSKKIF